MSKKIGIFVGSLRKKSFNRQLAENISGLLPDGYEAIFVPMDNLELYNQDLDDENRAPESWKAFRSLVGSLDAVLFVTPEYNRSVPAVLKNALDVASRPYGANQWESKPAAVVSSSIGAISGFGANHHLRQSLTFLNLYVMAQPEAYIAEVHTLLDENGRISNAGTTSFLQSFVDAFVGWINHF